MSIGERIKLARKQNGLTQSELAKKLGVAVVTIGQYERDVREPRLEQQRRIADALNVTIGYLQGYESFEAKQILDALNAGDVEKFEKLMNLKPGTTIFLSPGRPSTPESRARIERMMEKEPGYLDKIAARRDWPVRQQQLVNAFDMLNEEGQRKAIERVEELTEIPRYQHRTDGEVAKPDKDPE